MCVYLPELFRLNAKKTDFIQITKQGNNSLFYYNIIYKYQYDCFATANNSQWTSLNKTVF